MSGALCQTRTVLPMASISVWKLMNAGCDAGHRRHALCHPAALLPRRSAMEPLHELLRHHVLQHLHASHHILHLLGPLVSLLYPPPPPLPAPAMAQTWARGVSLNGENLNSGALMPAKFHDVYAPQELQCGWIICITLLDLCLYDGRPSRLPPPPFLFARGRCTWPRADDDLPCQWVRRPSANRDRRMGRYGDTGPAQRCRLHRSQFLGQQCDDVNTWQPSSHRPL